VIRPSLRLKMHQVDSIGATSPIWISCLVSRKTGVVAQNLIKEVCSLPVVRWYCCSICTLCSLTFVLCVVRGIIPKGGFGCFQSLRGPLVRAHTQFGASSTCLEAHPLPLSSGNGTTQAIPDQIPRHRNVRLNQDIFSNNNTRRSLRGWGLPFTDSLASYPQSFQSLKSAEREMKRPMRRRNLSGGSALSSVRRAVVYTACTSPRLLHLRASRRSISMVPLSSRPISKSGGTGALAGAGAVNNNSA
jgi:hypothetical protein